MAGGGGERCERAAVVSVACSGNAYVKRTKRAKVSRHLEGGGRGLSPPLTNPLLFERGRSFDEPILEGARLPLRDVLVVVRLREAGLPLKP